jgi:acyl-CoA thioesterase-1
MARVLWGRDWQLYAVVVQGFKVLIAVFLLAIPAQAGPKTVAALGDSLTAGLGLVRSQGFVPQLQAWLRDRGAEVKLINAGVSGDTTAGGLARLDWTLTPDVGALIVILGGNDFLRGIDPATSRANLSAILQGAQKRNLPVLLVGMPAPRNYGPEYRQAVERLYPELAAQYGVMLYPDFFLPVMNPATGFPDTGYLQADGLHPNARGVQRIVAGIGPVVLDWLGK